MVTEKEKVKPEVQRPSVRPLAFQNSAVDEEILPPCGKIPKLLGTLSVKMGSFGKADPFRLRAEPTLCPAK